MDIRLHKGTQYAIQALEWMVGQADGKPVDVQVVAQHVNVSPTYLAKIFQQLAQNQILVSHRGRMGGFSLGKGPDEIHLADIVMACEKFDRQRVCMLDGTICTGRKRHCRIHPVWLRIQTEIRNLLEKTSLADILEGAK